MKTLWTPKRKKTKLTKTFFFKKTTKSNCKENPSFWAERENNCYLNHAPSCLRIIPLLYDFTFTTLFLQFHLKFRLSKRRKSEKSNPENLIAIHLCWGCSNHTKMHQSKKIFLIAFRSRSYFIWIRSVTFFLSIFIWNIWIAVFLGKLKNQKKFLDLSRKYERFSSLGIRTKFGFFFEVLSK